MGIQDRDYYRNEGPSMFDSIMPRGFVCRWLIGLNVAMFFLQLVALASAPPNAVGIAGSGFVTEWLILDVDAVSGGQIWRLLTYAFLHAISGDFWFFHIVFNMLFLWYFGSDIEEHYGRREFLAIYLISALLGGAAFLIWSTVWADARYCLGASGAVTTMLILCALNFPRRLLYWFGVVPMPIWFFAILNIAQDAFVFVGGFKSNVAVVVHLAGAAFAVAYYQWQGSIVDVLSGFPWWHGFRGRARLKIYNPDAEDEEEAVAVTATSASAAAVDEHLEAKLDTVLEKIAKSGKESLTPEEQEVLKQAAEMYKRRRT
ncbi:MAG: rhomboid family intramembrane serine protease [Planctomycetes bacterium]|nr:rhomboid family intramembrane serine protease [Planctomycetota bacterium]